MTYTSELISFDLFLIPTAEAAFIHEVGELLLHHILDFLDGLFQSNLAGTGHVEIQRRVLERS